MLGTIQTIGTTCQSSFNAGFLTHLYLIDMNGVAFVIDSDDTLSPTTPQIGINPDAVITDIKLKSKTATFNEVMVPSTDGQAYQLQVNVPLSSPDKTFVEWVAKLGKRRFIGIMRDTLGYTYLAGSMGNGLRYGWNRSVADRNAKVFGLSLNNWHPIQYLTTHKPEELFPHREFDHSFDLSFS